MLYLHVLCPPFPSPGLKSEGHTSTELDRAEGWRAEPHNGGVFTLLPTYPQLWGEKVRQNQGQGRGGQVGSVTW